MCISSRWAMLRDAGCRMRKTAILQVSARGVRLAALCLLVIPCLVLPCRAMASPLNSQAPQLPPVVVEHVPDAVVTGSAAYSYLFWDLYQATLYAPHGQWQPEQPFALELRYLTDLTAGKIAAVSRDEMARQGSADPARLAAWEQRLLAILPDVQAGSVLTGIRQQDGTTRFYAGERDLGGVDDPAFSKAFFDIWLGDATRDKALRRQLLGERQD